jgi:hypothetical protein
MDAAATPASASACRMASFWLSPFGTVTPFVWPSWLTAVPRITAYT